MSDETIACNFIIISWYCISQFKLVLSFQSGNEHHSKLGKVLSLSFQYRP